MNKNFLIYSLLLSLVCWACNNNLEGNNSKLQQTTINNNAQQLEQVNKVLNEKDKDRIESFIRRHNINAKFNDAGFWMANIERGNNKQIKEGSAVAIKGVIKLLDGTDCYQYDEENPLIFIVGKSNEISNGDSQNAISGLHLALPLMHENERAVLIFLPSLAHGLIGDSKKIPPRSILVYDIRILEVK